MFGSGDREVGWAVKDMTVDGSPLARPQYRRLEWAWSRSWLASGLQALMLAEILPRRPAKHDPEETKTIQAPADIEQLLSEDKRWLGVETKRDGTVGEENQEQDSQP